MADNVGPSNEPAIICSDAGSTVFTPQNNNAPVNVSPFLNTSSSQQLSPQANASANASSTSSPLASSPLPSSGLQTAGSIGSVSQRPGGSKSASILLAKATFFGPAKYTSVEPNMENRPNMEIGSGCSHEPSEKSMEGKALNSSVSFKIKMKNTFEVDLNCFRRFSLKVFLPQTFLFTGGRLCGQKASHHNSPDSHHCIACPDWVGRVWNLSRSSKHGGQQQGNCQIHRNGYLD